MTVRQYDLLDKLILGLDRGLSSLHSQAMPTDRDNPADAVDESAMSADQQRLAIKLMRINHSGEVSAQALYQGQAMTARDSRVRDSMKCSAEEEIDHLLWCEQRINELGGHTSFLNPLWYLGSLTMGSIAGAFGDKWSLGFIAETEHQVVRHLQDHLQRLPKTDQKSRAILEQMQEDESHHATVALESGAAELPESVKALMQLTSKVMTRTAYWF